MYPKMNSNQKSVFKTVVPFILFALVFMVTFSACRDIREETETIIENSQKATDNFSVPEIEYNDDIPAVDDTYVIETQKNDDVYTFNYETRSPDEIIKMADTMKNIRSYVSEINKNSADTAPEEEEEIEL